MIIVDVCQRFGWTYQEYLEQPEWFLDLIKVRMDIDSRKEKQK